MASRLTLIAALVVLAGCDRNVEPFDPNEQPEQPDLSRIFPEGAEQAAQVGPPEMPAPPPGRGAPPMAAEAGAPDGPPISGRIALGDGLASRVPPGAVLYLIARRGPGPPVAVQRIASPRFPLEFTLGPGDKMVPNVPFSGELALSARLDGDGNAMSRSPGDLQGEARAPVAPGASGVEIVLDEVLGGESGPPAAAAAAGATGSAAAATDGPPISGRISLGDGLASRVPPGAVLFVVARGGPGPPVAVKRIAEPRFPLAFTLGPGDKIMQGVPFAGSLALSARLDGDGNAMSRSPGDLQGQARAPIAPGASGVEIVLDEVEGGQ